MGKSEKARLLILSDMWGKNRMEWLSAFTDRLKPYFKIDFKDCSELAEIDLPIFVEEALHYEYVRWGIDHAVPNLIQTPLEYDALLGMSIGGIIGWKGLIHGLKAKRFYGVSATRLRYETKKPDVPIHLYYGAKDLYKPDSEWLKSMNVRHQILPSGHEMYYEPEVVELICQQIIGDLIDEN